jgi:hypothetical protein
VEKRSGTPACRVPHVAAADRVTLPTCGQGSSLVAIAENARRCAGTCHERPRQAREASMAWLVLCSCSAERIREVVTWSIASCP